MKGKVVNSLRANSDRRYRDDFCDNFPHNNHVRTVYSEMVVQAMRDCAALTARQSNFCQLHCE